MFWVRLCSRNSEYQMYGETCWDSTTGHMTKEKYYHHVCAVSHHSHGGWKVLKCLSLCAHVTPSLWLHPAAYWIITAHPIFPALLKSWVILTLQLWLGCESPKMTCPCESRDSPLPVPWNYLSRNKIARGMCANVCLMKPNNCISWGDVLGLVVMTLLSSSDTLHCSAHTKQIVANSASQVIILLSQHRLRVNTEKEHKQSAFAPGVKMNNLNEVLNNNNLLIPKAIDLMYKSMQNVILVSQGMARYYTPLPQKWLSFSPHLDICVEPFHILSLTIMF